MNYTFQTKSRTAQPALGHYIVMRLGRENKGDRQCHFVQLLPQRLADISTKEWRFEDVTVPDH